MRVNPSGGVAYVLCCAPIVLVDDAVQFIPNITFPLMDYERRRRSCTRTTSQESQGAQSRG